MCSGHIDKISEFLKESAKRYFKLDSNTEINKMEMVGEATRMPCVEEVVGSIPEFKQIQ